jgi:hypothetical protein
MPVDFLFSPQWQADADGFGGWTFSKWLIRAQHNYNIESQTTVHIHPPVLLM